MLSLVIQFKIKMSAYSDDRIGGIAIDVRSEPTIFGLQHHNKIE